MTSPVAQPVCWHDTRTDTRHYRTCPARDGELILWGRCRSGRRWFWVASAPMAEPPRSIHGWADTENQASAAARAAVEQVAAGHPAIANVKHGHASHTLKTLNAERRRARPAGDSTDAGPAEYLYGISGGTENDPALRVVSFQITKKTPKRIYYIRQRYPSGDPVIGYVPRRDLEANGEVLNRAAGWAADFHLYAKPPSLVTWTPGPADPPTETVEDLRRLRREMGDAHPDRGGSAERFMAACAKYRTAQRRAATRRG